MRSDAPSSTTTPSPPPSHLRSPSPPPPPPPPLHPNPVSVVFTPRVPGQQLDRCQRSISPTLIRHVLDKSGMSLSVPPFLERMAADSRKASKSRQRPCSQHDHHGRSKAIRLRSSSPSLITVPLNSKQWLLQALGLKDSELLELFHQMESIPQFAAEYVREVKEEWQALESRDMKKPPEAEFLLKDQALLEKIRGLLIRFTDVKRPFGPLIKKHPEAQTSKDDNSKMSFGGQSRSIYLPDFQKSNNADVFAMETMPLREVEASSNETSQQRAVCTACGQPKALTDASSHGALTGVKQRASSPQSRHTLPSFIPVNDYIVKHCVVQPETSGKSEHKSRFSTHDKRWYTVLFPALQPGRREDVQLLGEWLQHSMNRNHYESPDGYFEDAEAVFLLHSIAFLEIVRQVDLHCEERGNLLLHVWRQLLRVFNQVMTCVEPFLNAKEEELTHANNCIDNMREQINHLIDQVDESKKQAKEKEMQLQKIKRCRLCVCENLTPRSREDTVKKVKTKAHKNATQPVHIEVKEEVREIPKRPASSKEEPDVENSVQEQKNISSTSLDTVDSKDESMLDLHTTAVHDSVTEDGTFQERSDSHSDVSRVDASTQTSEKGLKCRLRRSESAPGLLQGNVGDAKITVGPSEENHERELLLRSLVVSENPKATEDVSFLKLLGPPGPGSIPIPGTIIGASIDRILNFENLALETLNLLESLPELEGMQAAAVQNLKQNYSRLTGYVLKQRKEETKSSDHSLQNEVDAEQESELDPDKGRKKKPGKSIQAKFYVPTSFSKMMKINSVPKNLKSFNVRQVSKLLASVYSSKLEADAVDDAANNERQSCSEFVYDFMLNLYGLKGIAESAIHGIFKTIKGLITSKQMEKHHKVRLFSKFVGMEGEGFTEMDLYIYLKALQRAMLKPAVLLPSDQDDGLTYLNVAYIDYVIEEPNLTNFTGSETATRDLIMKFASKNTISEKASPEIKKLVKENEVKKLDWDYMMESILESRPRARVEEKDEPVPKKTVKEKVPLSEEKLQELVNLFIAGDANQDGVLTFTEFREIISTANPSISTQSALRIFRETLLLMPDGGDSISPQAFATVAHSHDVSAPAPVVFELLTKTWNQVQGDVNEEKMADEAQRKEFEDLRTRLMVLLAEKTNVTEAVQVFRNLVLKFCGGEDEEEDQDKDVEADSGEV